MASQNLREKGVPNPSPFSKYYAYTNNLVLPYNSKWRQFKIRLLNGKFLTVKKRIRNINDLKKVLLEFIPIDIYYSVSQWINPTVVSFNSFKGIKSGYELAYNLFLNGDLVFDIDGKGNNLIEKIEDAKSKTIKLIDILKEMGFNDFRIVFTGSKGFRIDVLDYKFEGYENLLPNQRMWAYYMEKKKIVDKAKEKGGVFCYNVSLDIKRIVRLIGSINSKTGYICSIINNLENFDLNKIKRVEI
jgi:DNA primase catalytic subunit